MRNTYLIFLISLVFIVNTFASKSEIDSQLNKTEKIIYQNPDSARILLKSLISEITEDALKAEVLRKIGISYDLQSNFDSAISNINRALIIAKRIKNDTIIGRCLNSLGVIYFNQADYPQSFEYYNLTLKEAEIIKDTLLIAKTLSNIGHIYFYQNDLEKARELYNQALEYGRIIHNTDIISNNYQNIGNIDYTERNLENAISDYLKSLKIDEESGNDYRAAYTLTGLAMISREVEDFEGALEYFNRSLELRRRLGDMNGVCNVYINLADLYIAMEDYDSSLDFARKSLSLSDSIESLEAKARSLEKIALAQEKKGLYENAIATFKEFLQAKDSVYNTENKERIKELEEKYESEKKSLQIAMLEKEKALKDEEVIIKDQQIELMGGGIFALIIIIFLAFRAYSNRKAAASNLSRQKEILQEKQDLLQRINKDMKDSIDYAKRIQINLLPSDDFFKSILPDAFVQYRPKDVVSGDFYWMEEKKGLVYFAVIDCTGHGVPGAMISVMAHNSVNRVFREFDFDDPGLFLDKLNELFEAELNKFSSEVNDGMDISLGIFDKNSGKLKIAGANQRAYFIGSDTLKVYKFNKQPVGPYYKREAFKTTEIDPNPGDQLFFFTDGFADQFGGENGKKYYYKNFKALIGDIYPLSTIEQGKKLNEVLNNWMIGYEQLDDVLVMGMKF